MGDTYKYSFSAIPVLEGKMWGDENIFYNFHWEISGPINFSYDEVNAYIDLVSDQIIEFDFNDKVVYFMVGPSGIGKSTWSTHKLKTHNKSSNNYFFISF
ncbi:MAG: hypothetical protein QXO70_05040 [Candidatus Pacearchaeota archaeon]